MQPEELETLASLRPNFLPRARQGEMAPMPRPIKKITNPSLESLYQKLEEAYVEWKNCPGHHSLLDHDRVLAMQGAELGMERSKSAYDNFDQAIFKIIRRSKQAIGDPRIIERIRQAELPQHRDKKFFDQLGDALKKNVGMNLKTSRRSDVAELYRCAQEYRNGNEVELRKTYDRWTSFDIDARRSQRPNDVVYQTMVDQWERAKYLIVGGNDKQEGGYDSFQDRIKRLAHALDKRSMPVSESTTLSKK
jgi:hypothetical protein